MKEPKSDPDKPGRSDNFTFLGIAILLFAGMAVLFSCKNNDIEVIKNLTEINQLPNQSARNIETVYSDSGQVQLIVKAALLKRFSAGEEPYYEFPQGLFVEFYGKDGLVDSRITANYAIYYENQELWEARDSVVATNRGGKILNTDLLFWNEKERRIYTDGLVKITTPDELIYGKGFEADQNFTDYQINKVTGTIYVEQ